MPLQIRRGLQAERNAMTVPLAAGELLYVTDDQRLYIGNGTTLGGIQVTGYTNEDAQEATAEALLGANPITSPDNSRHSGIVFVYDDDADRIDATVNFGNIDRLEANAFVGSLFADDSGLLVDGVAGAINLDGTVKGNIIPDEDEAYDIGSSLFKFKDLYLSGSSLYLGDAVITEVAGAVELPVGSTVAGDNILVQGGTLVGDLVGSVIGENSVIFIDATNNIISNGELTIDSNIITAAFDTLELSGPNIPNETQTQVNITVISAETTSSIFDAEGTWKSITVECFKGDGITPAQLDPISHSSGDVLAVFGIAGYQPDPDDGFPAIWGAQVDPAGTTIDDYIPTKQFWINKPPTEAANLADQKTIMTFDSFGRLAVNQENAQATVDINGFMKLAVLDTAPASPANGMVAIADGDAVDGWDPLTNGKQSMVVYLGGGWREIAAAP
jgi:hypothetical protein